MPASAGRTVIVHVFALLLSAVPLLAGQGAAPAASPDAKAIQELLEGTKGRREAWPATPELVVLSSVMDYASGDMANGYAATSEELTPDELSRLEADLTAALGALSDGVIRAFAGVRVEAVRAGGSVRVLRKGQIVVARYKGVQEKANTIGYGGRTADGSGRITAAAIILDSDFDRTDGLRRLLRTHELGHALGYNHVDAPVSVMNSRIGPEVSDFDKAAARMAFVVQEPAQ